MRFKVFSLGCKVNIYESEAISYALKQMGFTEAASNLDVQIINTCTVTQTSDMKSRKLIRSLIRENPGAITIVMGCYSQLGYQEISQIEGVDIILGTNKRNEIIDLLKTYKKGDPQIIDVSDATLFKKFEDLCLHEPSKHTRGFVKIQDGCENFCAYCAIPYARGPIKSRNPKSIIEEISFLVQNGVKEIIISGINTGTYGKDLGDINLAGLLELIITSVPNLYRIRLSSIELGEVTDELLDTLAKYETKIARHLHIPLQAGCDETLKRMGRKYDMATFLGRIAEIRTRFPGIAITTDCLAGFVGETEAEFQTTYQNFKQLAFAQAHIFPYSKRKGTKAFLMEGHLPKETIDERAHKLGELAKQAKLQYQKQFIGNIVEVLFEQKKGLFWYGHTSNYLEVKVKDQGIDLTNEVKLVELELITTDAILGKERLS